MAIRKRPQQKSVGKNKRKRALDAEDRVALIEKKASKKHKKLERAVQIQEARKRRQAIKEAGAIQIDEIKRALTGNLQSSVKESTCTDVSGILSSLGIQSHVGDFGWSSDEDSMDSESDMGTSESANEDSLSEADDVASRSDDALSVDSETGSDASLDDGSSDDENESLEIHPRISFPSTLDFSELSQDLLSKAMTGSDIVFASEQFHEKEVARSSYMMLAAHTLSHMLHKSARVERNNKKLKKRPDLELRDQGPNRARLLWLAPFRANAYELIRNWISLLNIDDSSESSANLKSFLEEYEGQDERNEHSKNWEDWRRELFKGHYDDANYDDFVIGISFNHGKMRIQFPKSSQALCLVDVIIASPLSLSRIAAADRKTIRVREKFAPKQEDSEEPSITPTEDEPTDLPPVMDFLSAIEILVVDRIDALAMQNWENCNDVVSAVNAKAVATITADINRIEEKFLSPDSAKLARQTILVAGSTLMDCYNSLLPRPDRTVYVGQSGGLSGLYLNRALKQKIKQQFFIRVPITDVEQRQEALLDHFKTHFWKDVGNEVRQLVIVVAHTSDLAPLMEFLDDEGIVDCCLAETTLSDIGGKRRKQIKSTLKAFREGNIRLIVVTERLLWYQRIRITGGRHVFYFGCPRTSSVYTDVLADVVDPLRCTSTCIYTANERTELERIVGSRNIEKLVPHDAAIEELGGKSTVFTP